jgi:predicted aspartyl protease
MPRKKKSEIELHVANIREDGYHVFVYISVNGQYTRMLLDTGASRTVFDINWLREVHADIEMEENEDKATGLGSSEVENFIVFLDEVRISQCTLTNYQVGALNLEHVNLSYQYMGLPSIGGVLGSDILVHFNAVIDLGKAKMALYQ